MSLPQIYFPVTDYTRISSGYGARSSPGGIGSTFHRGIDIAAPSGTPVIAPTDIKITQAGWSGGYGNLVRGMDSAGNTYDFAHLNSIGVSSGQTIAAGTALGTVGSTGKSTGPHLHFGIKDKAGNFIDPSRLLANAKTLGNDLIGKAKDAILKAAKLNPVTGPALAVGSALGIGGEDCGINPICYLRKWWKETDFIPRAGLTIVAILLIMGGVLLLARGQTGRIISTVKKAAT